MKTFKEFREHYHNLPLLTEKEEQILRKILQESKDSDDYYEKMKKEGNLGPLLGKGSSRAAHAAGNMLIKLRQYHPNGKHFGEDGRPFNLVDHSVPVVHKFAMTHYRSYDSVRLYGQLKLGEEQNLNEADTVYDHLRTYRKHADGTYSANPHGILPTVFYSDREGRVNISERASPVTNEDFYRHVGIHPGDLSSFLQDNHDEERIGLRSYTGAKVENYQDNRDHKLTNNHPNVRPFIDLVREGVHPGDIRAPNLGMSQNHPHGPKPLLLDSGFVGNRPGLYNTVRSYAEREARKYAADRAKRRLGIPSTKYDSE